MKKCTNCNEEFEPNSGKQKFCSDKCKVAFSRNKLGNLSDKVITADKIPENAYNGKKANWMKIDEAGLVFQKPRKWIKEIEDYCEKEGITPEDLILSYRERKKPQKHKKGTNTPKNDESAENGSKTGNSGHSNWFEGYRKSKLGIK